jgi:hypothetical protein
MKEKKFARDSRHSAEAEILEKGESYGDHFNYPSA